MFRALKTFRDAALSAGMILALFGTPVVGVAIRNAPVMPVLESPETVSRTVYLPPAPPAPPEGDSPDVKPDKPATEPTADNPKPVAKGGSGPVVAATTTRVMGRTATMTRGDVRGQGVVSSLRPKVSKPRTRRGRRCTPDNPLIVLNNDGSRVVERDLLDTYAGDIKALNRLGWITKHNPEGGKSDGILVRGIRCGNDLHELGIRNNDVVHSVNGKPVRNLVGAISLYFRLKGKEDFEVKLTRGGRLVTLNYRLT